MSDKINVTIKYNKHRYKQTMLSYFNIVCYFV